MKHSRGISASVPKQSKRCIWTNRRTDHLSVVQFESSYHKKYIYYVQPEYRRKLIRQLKLSEKRRAAAFFAFLALPIGLGLLFVKPLYLIPFSILLLALIFHAPVAVFLKPELLGFRMSNYLVRIGGFLIFLATLLQLL